MPCYHPKTVWRSSKVTLPSGKCKIFFKKPGHWFDKTTKVCVSFNPPVFSTPFDFYQPEEIQIPCGKMCVGCQEDYSRSWAVRCWHESMCFDENCFITLTYNDKWIPEEGLLKRHFQLFMKRLRRFIAEGATHPKGVRFYGVGEYGAENFRPHFHACIFGYDFPDRKFWTEREDVKLYTSDILSSLWSHPVTKESYGFSTVGDVTFESAAYLARYCSSKVRGDDAKKHYGKKNPEFTLMSRRPGIGKNWFIAYKDSVFPDDSVVLRSGGKCKVPRYYDKLYSLTDPLKSVKVKSVRVARAKACPDNTPERLSAREKVKKAQVKMLKRSLQ